MRKIISISLIAMLLLAACQQERITLTGHLDALPSVYPDYRNVTVPCNIAPLNFSYLGGGECCLLVEGRSGTVQIKGDGGLFDLSSAWAELMEANKGGSLKLTVAVEKNGEWAGYRAFQIHVSPDSIDPYLSYRLIPPGYRGWDQMGIYQRDLESYEQTAIYENTLTNRNCVNCHSYCQGNPDRMLFHSRAVFAGTVMLRGGELEKLNTKTDSTLSALVYPYWHPSGRYVAFSVNKTYQDFFNHHANRIEVYDAASDVVVYNVATKQIAYSPLTKSEKAFETFPTFSPDGKSLYFCTAEAVDSMPQKYRKVKYSLCRIDFHPADMSFGNRVDTLYNAVRNGRSVCLPRVSPDGRMLVFTLQEFGNFAIWHKDADLYAVNLRTRDCYPLSEANSKDVDSYHSWSRNSRWLVFSSRRGDGLYTRPYIAYIGKDGKARKPFLLPQQNPLKYYKALMFSYNIPELMVKKATVSKAAIADLLRNGKGADVSVKK
ncbi:PD40 domain-containing protein [Prevotella sp. KH2C16]|uniref:TolB family protein n=1 Tax=Prevotella sp. KH2C16 TaxID=1855325 RepID=UPI0008F2A6D7|nr:PD40 domain-containing protein [Prevotella sp. KH2C16]SFF85367.1 WD40-like Beta Propeller Repeat [Prevotella sp. KH2C16]